MAVALGDVDSVIAGELLTRDAADSQGGRELLAIGVPVGNGRSFSSDIQVNFWDSIGAPNAPTPVAIIQSRRLDSPNRVTVGTFTDLALWMMENEPGLITIQPDLTVTVPRESAN